MHTAADIQTGNPDIDLFAGTGGLLEDLLGYPSVVASGLFLWSFPQQLRDIRHEQECGKE